MSTGDETDSDIKNSTFGGAEGTAQFYIVGIGASEGGLEALTNLFDHMPIDSGMVFVVAQDSESVSESEIKELLAQHTKMPIHHLDDRNSVKSNNIYLIPPNKEIAISGGHLRVTDRSTKPRDCPEIDLRDDRAVLKEALEVSDTRAEQQLAENEVLTEVDPLKQVEVELQRLSAIVESSADAIIGKDLDGQITSWNKGAENLYGYTAEETVGQNVSLIATNSRKEEYKGLLAKILEGQDVPPLETVRLRKDGSRVTVSLRVSPIRDISGKVVGASSIARDVTELKRVREELQRSLRRRDRFLAMLSHELRNPLGAVQNATQILNMDSSDTQRAEIAREIILRQTRHMSSLLDDLLDTSRIAEGKINLDKRQINLVSTVSDVVNVMQGTFEKRNQQLEVLVPEEPLWVNADPVRLQQIQVNLLTNAARYSPDGATVVLRIYREKNEAIISVRDHGKGIPVDSQDQIFEPFIQVNESSGQADGGMGIGLALVKALVQSHKGTIHVQSDGVGHGSEFVVRLPIERKMVGTEDAPSRGSAKERSSKRIVLVEDIADNRAVLKSLLELEGHEVQTAENGEQGVELILDYLPDLVFVDLGLPDIDGCEVARRVREAEQHRKLHLIALTGFGRPQDIERTKAAGFDAHLVKPLDRDKLAKALEMFSD